MAHGSQEPHRVVRFDSLHLGQFPICTVHFRFHEYGRVIPDLVQSVAKWRCAFRLFVSAGVPAAATELGVLRKRDGMGREDKCVVA